MNRSDFAAASAFLVVGLLLLTSAATFPPGVGGLPGPGFFPRVIGAVMAALAALLLAFAWRRPGPAPGAAPLKPVLLTVLLLAGYLALWERVPLAPRTLLFVALYLRCLGQSWRAAVQVALGLTLFVVAAFQYGLRVGLP